MSTKAYNAATAAAKEALWQGKPVHEVVWTALDAYEGQLDNHIPDPVDPDPDTDEAAKRKRWKMFSHMRYANMPDLGELGFVQPNPKIWYEKAYGQGDVVTSTPSSDQLRNMALQSPKYVIHDIENRLKANDWEMTQPIADIYVNTVQRFKAHHADDGVVGVYATTTRRNYWDALEGPDDEGYKSWQAENDKRQDIADAVDVLYPSLYNLTVDFGKWKIFAERNIAETVRTGKNKKIYAFVWPEFHSALVDSNDLKRTPVSDVYWRSMLEYLWDHPYVDGFVIWNLSEKKLVDFKDIPDWWGATVDFINDHKLA